MDKTPLTLSAEAISALEQGNKIEAIKIYKESTGVGLKEAKEAIEAYWESSPVINERFKQPAATGSAKTVIVVFLIVAVAYWWFKG